MYPLPPTTPAHLIVNGRPIVYDREAYERDTRAGWTPRQIAAAQLAALDDCKFSFVTRARLAQAEMRGML